MGPLQGIRVVEVAGIGPGPFCAMMLADMGADVLRVDRPGGNPLRFGDPRRDVLTRSRPAISLDLKQPEGLAALLRLADRADVLVEGFRPGVAERLGFGPEVCRERNPRLVYGRMTGWGQEGPLAGDAGHDIDYLAVAGVLATIGPAERPVPPLNLVADYGGGGMLLAFGVAAALVERANSGQGQVVDAAMVDGAALLAAATHGMRAMGAWTDERAANLLDGGAPCYDVYETADGGFMAVGALEPQFYAALLAGLGIDGEDLPAQYDRDGWPETRRRLAAVFRTRSREEWTAVFGGTDACCVPVLGLGEAPDHPHNRARGTFVAVEGVTQPAPAPRFDRTPAGAVRAPEPPGSAGDRALAAWGFTAAEVAALRHRGVLV